MYKENKLSWNKVDNESKFENPRNQDPQVKLKQPPKKLIREGKDGEHYSSKRQLND